MPRYRVVLEFDHPGQGVPVENGSTLNTPEKWRWDMRFGDEVTDLRVSVFETRDVWLGGSEYEAGTL